jgi:hypothetical protein
MLMAREAQEKKSLYSQTTGLSWNKHHVPNSGPFGADEKTHPSARAPT